MEKLTQKWCIASFFDELEDGFEFHRTENPLHITLAGVFGVNLLGVNILNKLQDLLVQTSSFSVKAGEEVKWGENKDLLVVLIQESKNLKLLQINIYSELVSIGAIFNEPQYEGRGHISHSTAQRTGKLNHNDEVLINKVSLVDMFPDNDGHKRRIVGTVHLNK